MKENKVIDPYELKEELGEGGFAIVYLAHDSRFERDVAFKFMSEKLLNEETFHKRFDREAKIIAKLEHPAIVPVYDIGSDNGRPYMVMRYMRGGSLKDSLKKGEPISISKVCDIALRLASALDYAHSKEIIHRDIKPGNVLLDRYGQSYLSDFGIARMLSEKELTQTDAIIGSQPYMAPEQWRGEKVTSQTDVYQFGVLLYEMLAGKRPFHADDPVSYIYHHTQGDIPAITENNAELPKDCDQIFKIALAKKPEDRYYSASELTQALIAVVSPDHRPLQRALTLISDKVKRNGFTGYQILAEMEPGNLAIVYHARDLSSNSEVAIKLFPPELLDPESLDNLVKHRQLVTLLKNEAIVPIHKYEIDRTAKNAYIVMRYMVGGSLSLDLAKDEPFSLIEASRLFHRIGPALSEAHEKQIIHGDIKPSNILKDASGDYYLTDFNLLPIIRETTTVSIANIANEISSYTPPEQQRGALPTVATDIYQLGILLFEMLTGERPFSAENISDWKRQRLDENVPNITDINPELPQSCNEIIKRALSNNPAQRFSNVNEMTAAVSQAAEEKALLDKEAKLARMHQSAMEAFDTEKWEEAISLLEPIITIDPDYENAYKTAQIAQQRLEETFAAEQAERAAQFSAQRKKVAADIALQAANAYAKKEQWPQAIEKFEEALSSVPELEDVRIGLAEAKTQWRLKQFYIEASELIDRKEWSSAINKLKTIQSIEKNYKDSESKLTVAQKELGYERTFNEAERLLARGRLGSARERFKQLPDGYEGVAYRLDKIKRLEELEQLYETANIAVDNKDWDRAIAHYQNVIKIDPLYRDTADRLVEARNEKRRAECFAKGKAAFDQKNWQQAIDILQECPDYKNANQLIEDAQRRLKFSGKTVTISIVVDEQFEEFEGKQAPFLQALATVLDIDVSQIKVIDIVAGSVKITLEIPEEAAQSLINLFELDSAHITRLKIMEVGSNSESNDTLHEVPQGRISIPQLHKAITNNFSSSELKTLISVYLNEDDDNIPGQAKSEKVTELIKYMRRRGRLNDLIAAVRKRNPTAFENPEQNSAPSNEIPSPASLSDTQSPGFLRSNKMAYKMAIYITAMAVVLIAIILLNNNNNILSFLFPSTPTPSSTLTPAELNSCLETAEATLTVTDEQSGVRTMDYSLTQEDIPLASPTAELQFDLSSDEPGCADKNIYIELIQWSSLNRASIVQDASSPYLATFSPSNDFVSDVITVSVFVKGGNLDEPREFHFRFLTTR